MANYESKLLSKILDTEDFGAIHKYNLTEQDFTAQSKAFKYIDNYINVYKKIPAFTTVVAECPEFEYVPEVPDHMEYLCKRVKADSAKRLSFELLQNQATKKFDVLNGNDFIDWLYEETAKIKEITSAESSFGTNFATTGEKRKELYDKAKELGDKQFIPTPYTELNNWLQGGFEYGDYVLLQAYTNRGKSWLATDFGLTAWKNGIGVLHYSPEMSEKQQLQRLDTLNGHFRNSLLRCGKLTEREEEKFYKYLESFNEENETPYIIKTMGDLPKGLSVESIEADLRENKNIGLVIIDGFTLMNHKGKDGNRNNMTNTSRKLRQLFGRYEVTGIVVHQIPTSAEKENQQEDETGARIVEPPTLEQYSETVAVIQDACTILNFDQADGVGKIRLAKARTPYVNKILELQCDFDIGIIKEVSSIDFI